MFRLIYSNFEKGCREKCTRQSRKVIWDMINTLFLATVAVEPTFVAFLQHSQTHFHGLSCQFFQISLKNRELKTTHNAFQDCRVHFSRQPFSKLLYMSLNILFSSCWGKFWPKRFKIGLFLKQKYEIFRKIFGILDIFLRISGKIFRRFYVIFVSRPNHKFISFIITVTCLPASLQKYKGVTLPYLTWMGDGNNNVKRAMAILIKPTPMHCVPVA